MDGRLEDVHRGLPRLGKSPGVPCIPGILGRLPARRAAQVDLLMVFEPE